MTEAYPKAEQDGLVIPHRIFTGTRAEKITVSSVLALSMLRFTPFIFKGVEVRGVLPDPLDVENHIGNLSVTYAITSEFAHGWFGSRWSLQTQQETKRDNKRAAAIVGTVAVAANVVAEKYGYGAFSTPDTWDFIYGCLGGYLSYKVAKPKFFGPEAVKDAEENYPENSYVKKRIRNLREEKAEDFANTKNQETKSVANTSRNRKHNGRSKKSARKQQRQARKRNR